MTTEKSKVLRDTLLHVTAKVTTAADIEGMHKCPRCWHWHTIQRNYNNLCDRCCKVLIEDYPDDPSVPHIKAAFRQWHKPLIQNEPASTK